MLALMDQSPTSQPAAVANQSQTQGAVTKTESSPAAPPKPPVWQTWKFWSAILLIVTIGALSYYYENVKDQFPWLVGLQLWTYGRMSHAQARASRPKWVVGVEVDNRSFFGTPMNRKGPEDITDRAFLARVIDNAVSANAAVIALDINLVREETNAESTAADNDALWRAIQNASDHHVPVILTLAFDTKAMRPLNNIFGPDRMPICSDPVDLYAPRAGFDHGPEDKRKVPLVVDAASQDGNNQIACRSFALQVVDAYERLVGIRPTTVERLDRTIDERQFAYTMFMPQEKFGQPISAVDVYNGDAAALRRLDHRIVLVGGNRTTWPTDNPHPPIGDMLDYHRSPEGPMAGMYFHANYVEGLLDDRIQSTIPRRLAALIDMLLATAIILAINLLDGAIRVLTVVLLIVFPVIIAYTAMVTLGYCFDFVLPVILSFLHPALEKYIDLPEHLFRRHSHA